MFGTTQFGGAPFGGPGALAPAPIRGHVTVMIETDPPTDGWEPILLGTDVVFNMSFDALLGDAPVEPSSVTCSVLSPRGTREPLTASREGLGAWSASFTPSLPGRWEYRIQTAGAIDAVAEGVFWVANSDFI